MEHEVFVPVPVQRLRAALADPAQVARALPGLQQDAGTEPVAGRLKVRIGGHSITYRGAVRVLARPDGTYTAEGEASEVRGSGTVTFAVTVRVVEAEAGAGAGESRATLVFEGTGTAGGRVGELAPDAVRSAVARLLSRFAENLGAGGARPEAVEPAESPEAGQSPEAPQSPEPLVSPESSQSPESPEPSESSGPPESSGPSESSGPPESSAAEGLAPFAAGDFDAEPPAEAAHARRTMIGRSAEEVDHAPPRGRYAPVPAPLTVSAGPTLRWAAPAAALVVASAIVVGRALRRRR
ncbi:SRPBCC family protein [Streptomyces sp. NPDC047017]|uniref:SRPBCC family protein n=1 Tax=Streptomyces sp. NPDC047017 TaxID=3155024 RepID=UPI0033FF05C6